MITKLKKSLQMIYLTPEVLQGFIEKEKATLEKFITHIHILKANPREVLEIVSRRRLLLESTGRLWFHKLKRELTKYHMTCSSCKLLQSILRKQK